MNRQPIEYEEIAPVAERFWAKVRHRGPGCWLWTGGRNQEGYGRFRMASGRTGTAHRISWVIAKGVDIDAGLQLDHLCRNTGCVNPEHLQPVDPSTNSRRSSNGFDLDGTCRHRGHDVTSPGAVYVYPDGRRACRACRAEARAEESRIRSERRKSA